MIDAIPCVASFVTAFKIRDAISHTQHRTAYIMLPGVQRGVDILLQAVVGRCRVTCSEGSVACASTPR